ncbi:BTAD domain-containing putative transcriptional regulator [Actinokineospora sp. UTMC 2448]|uniref:BTAD domain-containing putative transcriptional regulator n=1 Tax=Actinokineospora sp. UTMC 2448 TaxID=2268449 RepID=UPI0021645CE9|nr:BTAD domain-containing putative transcriptional regulator [Actinokineospora sp. UTMC 2448]UVS78557.1 Regulatory protein AfsR [Actinokineospora sp. UTMC 2448]
MGETGVEPRFHLFGAIEAHAGGRRVDLGGERERALLAALLLAKGQPVARHDLPDWIWDKAPRSAFDDLNRLMTEIRKRLRTIGLGTALVNKDGLCRLDVPAEAVDLHRFRALVAQARAADDHQAAELLGTALDIASGEPFGSLAGQRVQNQRHAVNEERRAAELRFLSVELRLGRHRDRIADLVRLFGERPDDSAVAELAIRALHLAGRQAEALRTYDEHRDALAELGLDVPRPLADLHLLVLRDDDRLRVAEEERTPAPKQTGASVIDVPPAELWAARDLTVPQEAVTALADRHLAVLVGDPALCRATALRLLGELGPDLPVLEVVKRWREPAVALLPPAAPPRGYLLTLDDPLRDRPSAAFAEDLLVHAGRLAEHGSSLVVAVRPELWRECWPVCAAVTVPLVRTASSATAPPDCEHLRITDPDGEESVFRLRDGRAPRATVSLGRLVPHDPPPDIVLDSGAPSPVSRRHAAIEHAEGEWWFIPLGKNAPSVLRRGHADAERVDDRIRLKDGDAVLIDARLSASGQGRRWRLVFTDPQETTTNRGDDR